MPALGKYELHEVLGRGRGTASTRLRPEPVAPQRPRKCAQPPD